MNVRCTAALLLVVATAAGCLEAERGEGVVKRVISQIDGEPVVPRAANRILISDPANLTSREDLAGRLFPKLREAISLDGRLGVVAGGEEADLVLSVTITLCETQVIAYDQLGRPRRKRLHIVSSVSLLDIARRKVIFTDGALPAFREFSDQTPPIKSAEQALNEVLDDLARRIAVKTVTGWYTTLMSPVEKAEKDRGSPR